MFWLYNKWEKKALQISLWIQRQFGHLGWNVATNPTRTCLLVLLFIFLCATGFLNMKVLSDTEDLWIPPRSESFLAEKYASKFFGKPTRPSTTLFTQPDGNVLTMESFDLLWHVHQETVNLEFDGQQWDDLCAFRSRTGECVVRGPTQFWSNNKTLYDLTVHNDEDLREAVSALVYPSGEGVKREVIFGLYTTSSDNKLESAVGMSQIYYSSGELEDTVIDWEQKFIDRMEAVLSANERDDSSTNFHFISDRSIDDELARASEGDALTFILSYSLMLTFTAMCISRRYNAVETRIGLSMCGILCIVMGIISGYGLCSGFGVPFNQLHLLLPFIVVGIGVDDLIIITLTFDQTDTTQSPETRIKTTLESCGMSIAFTTLTDIVAFLLGSSSSIPAIQGFCTYAAFTLFFNFVFQVTAFTAMLCQDAKRMNAGRADIFCCVMRGAKMSAVQPIALAGEDEDEDEAEKLEESSVNVHSKGVDDDKTAGGSGSGEMTKAQYFFSEIYFPFINNLTVRVMVVVMFAFFFALSIYSALQLDVGLDIIILVPDDSYAKNFIVRAREVELFAYDSNVPVSLFMEEVKYNEMETTEKIIAMQENFLEEKYNTGPVTSWVSAFAVWVGASPYNMTLDSNGYLTDEDQYYQAVEEFVSDPRFSYFADDIVFNYKDSESSGNSSSNGVKNIRISRVKAYHSGIDSSHKKVHALLSTRDVCNEANLSPESFAVAAFYKFSEIDIIILQELLFNLSLAVFAVGFISLFVLVNPKIVLLVCGLIISVDVEILGMMVVWDLTLSTVTLVQLVMAVGLVVDYMAHIAHHYTIQSFRLYPSNDLKLQATMREIAPSVALGCSTTLLGVLPLAQAESTLFRMFFKMLLCIVTFGALHGFVLLPAILPWISVEAHGEDCAVTGEMIAERPKVIDDPQKKVEDGKIIEIHSCHQDEVTL